ncbi:retinal pigment epithelial membrane protein [Hypoxylon rubiginosum]|uniref:Retinal pigment epithelial membrane protein n=1 Tax=Hypoxylon rubiginosum TaxID=110542 RepID=A0ACB9Z794_9PEZI|nr:retinal pigment epithelial membrane protein [Hypoxylon rubiginosum]
MERKSRIRHPYLSGNFAPIKQTRPLTRCTHVGRIPKELAGGQYVRNGANPITNDDLGRDAHWFDGDGMLAGVLFRRGEKSGGIEPEFVNQYILTDVFLNAKDNYNLKRPLLPSIATLIRASLITVAVVVFRTLILVFLSRLPGSRKAIRRISVANTSVVYHDGRALATCESGPPIRFQLPGLDTVGWYNGRRAENESSPDDRSGFGGGGAMPFMKEWTTGHPRVDPITKELISFHAVFVKPFVYYSIVSPDTALAKESSRNSRFDVPIPGMSSPKMMHDFGVSARYTVIMDLPLSLNPMNSIRGRPVISYESAARSRYGVFPRYEPDKIQWFETNPCVIFHTANCWETTSTMPGAETCVHLVACRLTSAAVVFGAGALLPPVPKPAPPEYTEEEQCRLYYYSFPLVGEESDEGPMIRNQWALSAIPFEFPTLSSTHAMREARYIYGCSTGVSSFSTALGKSVKIDCIAKVDASTLISRGIANPPQQIKGCVDTRTIDEVMKSTDADDPVKLFQLPKGWFAQEPRFVSRGNPKTEDDGWLLTYVFDESQLNDDGECGDGAASELWIIDARNMRDIAARVKLPQRVPYGLHGAWFSEDDIASQRPYETVRREASKADIDTSNILSTARDIIEKWIG